MYISKLIHTIETYDPYGIHRVNGIKIVYVLFVLFAVNGLFSISDAYFYFFYIPLTAMTAEVQGQTIRHKYKLFIATTLGAIGLIYLFNVIFPAPVLFFLFAFVTIVIMYSVVVRFDQSYLVLVPIILSMVSYSFNYREANGELYAILNHGITTLLAMFVILGALILFPLSFYYRVWLKTFYALTTLCLNNFKAIHRGDQPTLAHGMLIQFITFSRMVPRTMPTYTLLKITLLIHELYLLSLVAGKPPTQIAPAEVENYIDTLTAFIRAIKKENPCHVSDSKNNPLFKIINAWNYLCLNS